MSRAVQHIRVRCPRCRKAYRDTTHGYNVRRFGDRNVVCLDCNYRWRSTAATIETVTELKGLR